jgi:hypothetical protein
VSDDALPPPSVPPTGPPPSAAYADAGHPQPLSRRGRAVTRRRDPASEAAGPPPGAVGGAPARVHGDGVEEGPPPRRFGRRPPAHAASAAVRRRRTAVLAGMGLLTAAGAALAVAGLATVRNSTVGRYQTTLAPTDPGYQAYVVSTPTMAALYPGPDGQLAGAAVLALEPGDKGGTVIIVPPATVVPPAQAGPAPSPSAPPPPTLGQVYARQGEAAAMAALGRVVTVGVPDHVVVDDAHWARLVAPVAPIEVTLDRPVGEWPAGRVRLEADDVGRFMSFKAPNESDLDRLDRQERFWEAWLREVARGGDDAVPGEVDTGLGRFVRGVAAGQGDAIGLPVARDDTGRQARLVADAGQLARLVSRSVPFPTSPEAGTRVRVRLLNGTGDEALTTDAARALVVADAEIVIVGNAPSFDVDRTTIDYSGPDRRPLAQWLQARGGIGRLREIPAGGENLLASDDEIDVTVILGADARDLIGR